MVEDRTVERPAAGGGGESFALIVVSGPDAGARLVIGGDERLVVGTIRSADLRLTDPTTSRRHALFEVEDGRLRVTDLSSTNGTYVNDVQVSLAHLGGGESLRVGETVLRVEVLDGPRGEEAEASGFRRFIGRCPAIARAITLGEALAQTDTWVLIEGETGTGKELFAECLHEGGPSREGPFVVLDCRTLSIFGFDRSRSAGRAGGAEDLAALVDAAEGGVLFLDEPAALSLDVQEALVGLLDRRTVAAGSGAPSGTRGVRVVAATARPLERAVEVGGFRSDLLYRLTGARVELPPLRAREGDVVLLADAFWRAQGGQGALPSVIVERYRGYEWPGNVRELKQTIALAIGLGDSVASLAPKASAAAAPDDAAFRFSLVLEGDPSFQEARRRVLAEFERAYVERALARFDGHVGRASSALGIGRRYFQMVRARSGK